MELSGQGVSDFLSNGLPITSINKSIPVVLLSASGKWLTRLPRVGVTHIEALPIIAYNRAAMTMGLSMELKSTELKVQSVRDVYRTAGMLAVFSVFLLVEGMVRVTLIIASNHDGDWDGEAGETFPGVVLLLGGVIEVIAGFGGLLRALAVILFDYHNAAVTQFSVILMFLGWFTFVVFVFADPAYAVSQAKESPVVGLSLGQYKGVVTLGILGSVAYCAALQGGQMFFALQLLMTEKEKGSQYTSSYYGARLMYYSALALIGGVSQLAIGLLVGGKVGTGRLLGSERVGAPPYFIVYPELNIAAGLMVVVAAVVGFSRAVIRSPKGRGLFCGLWALTWLVQIMFMAAAQLGLWAEETLLERRALVFVSGMLVVLSLSLSILPPYMDAMVHHDETVAQRNELKSMA